MKRSTLHLSLSSTFSVNDSTGARGSLRSALLDGIFLALLLMATLLAARPVAAAPATAIAAGQFHTCALTTSGAVQCWGDNGAGQVGDGTTTRRLTPVPVTSLSSGVAKIAAGDRHNCALITGGAIQCWGSNSSGQIGDGTQTRRLIPVPVTGLSSGVAALAPGSFHTCALTTGGAVQCWGANGNGQLGDGTTTDHHTPMPVTGLSSGVPAIAAGNYHTCALTMSGAVQCWGFNAIGQLGDGTTTDHLTPVPVTGLSSGVTAIAAGESHTCALTTGGAVQCWGWNRFGQLGDGTTTDHLTPVPVTGLSSGVTAIAAGKGHTCALTMSGAVLCWGFNAGGRLGDGTTMDRHAPVPVTSLTSGVTAIAAGGEHNCALIADGSIQCWGWNGYGELGNGTMTESHTPVTVTGFGPAGVLQFEAASYTVAEGGGAFTITVIRTGGSVGAVSVQYASANGTAIAPGDYAATSGTLTWADGDATPKTFTVPIVDDALFESGETVSLALSGPTNGATLGAAANATLNITDNDVPPVAQPAQPVPTLSQWGLMLLASLMAGLTLQRRRRRRSAEP